MAVVLLAVNVVGFSPSYYLKWVSGAPALPLRAHVHGALFSAWIVLLLVQAGLVARGHVRLHRSLGWAGAVLAALMVVSGGVMLWVRALEYGAVPDADPRALAGTAAITWANLYLLTGFSICVALAVRLRTRPESHKRLLLLASIAMMPQSLGRIAGFRLVGVEDDVLFSVLGFLVLLLALAVHDRIADGRLHPVTRWGAPALFALGVALGVYVPTTAFGQALVLAMNRWGR